MSHSNQTVSIAFFGGEPLGVPVLEHLKNAGILPTLIVCNPDTAQGRKHLITPPPIKTWAIENGIDVVQPASLTEPAIVEKLEKSGCDLFVVVAYGKIIPQNIISIPKYKTINMHPSLLPAFRGPSPIRSAILADQPHTGVTIIELDEKLDHGPILAQIEMHIKGGAWPMSGNELDTVLAEKGASLLLEVIPKWIAGTITPVEQNHTQATFTKKITKDMGELDIDPFNLPSGKEAYNIYLKICAFEGFPGTFFFYDTKRIKITHARLNTGNLEILSVLPEGRKEILFKDYLTMISV